MYKVLILLLSSLLFSCGQKKEMSSTETQSESAEALISELMPPAEFIKTYKETAGAVLVDLRTPEELNAGMIEGAINIDFKDEKFKSNLELLDKDVPYFVYCARGGRSGNAATMMKELKFKKVYDMDGGFIAWTAEGLPVSAKLAD